MPNNARQVEISGKFSDVLIIQELRGSYPNVPISSDVDYAELIKGDDDPVFLTLPIGKPNVKSSNGRFYDEAFIRELARQTLELKPVGIMGHLRAEELATAFPLEAIHWVGATFADDGMLWGKGYIPPGEVRSRVRRYKAQGRALATSIDAFADGKFDATLNAYRMDANTLRLGQIDLAPADRAGIPDLASVPHLTQEMRQDDDPAPESDDDAQEQYDMSKLEVIREMTADDAKILPEPVRAAVLASATPAPEIGQIKEIRTELGIKGDADPVAAVREMRQTIEAQRKTSIQSRINEIVNDAEKGIKVEAVRPMVREMISLRNPSSVEEVDRIYEEISKSEPVTKALAAFVQGAMGPAQTSPVGAQNGTAKYFPIPEEA